MRTDRRKSQKRKRAVRKRFFAFLTTIIIIIGLVAFRDNLYAAILDMTGDKNETENTPPPATEAPVESEEPGETDEPQDPVITDTEPPVIEGGDRLEVFVGDKVSYRSHVTVTDNMDDNVKLEIDSSQVNLREPGTYTVTYTATDSAGNAATKTIEIIVNEPPVVHPHEDEVYQLADQVLESIFTEDMTPRKKARAIYVWVRSNIRYDNDYENNTDWLQAAYDGFDKKKGDCYVYFGITKALLNRAGIENLDIVKTGGGHYWSMVNLGEGWYHYDTTPRKTGGEFFMMTDADLKAYSDKYGNSHVWDSDKYPATPLE